MKSVGNFDKRGRYYTTAEKESLKSGKFEEAAEICRSRHSDKAVYMAFTRAADPRLTPDGIPKTLARLSFRLGIRDYKTATPSRIKGRKPRSRQNEILNYLASLPNAENYGEEHWLDTPELWPFVDPVTIRYPYGDSCGDLRTALKTRMESWCDRWIPFSRTSFSEADTVIPESLYLFPFGGEVKDRQIPRSRKRYAEDNTFLAFSQAEGKKEKTEISGSAKSGILELSGRMSIGYISFRFNVTVADVIDVISSGNTQESL